MSFITCLKSKVHGIRVTEANLNYEGSITLDPELMLRADIREHEQVHILNKNNGERFITYAIKGAPNSKVCCLNGPSARLIQVNDIIIILTYELIEKEKSIQEPILILPKDLKLLGYECEL